MARRITDLLDEAIAAQRLLGLIERHGWNIAQMPGGVKVFTWA